MIRLPASVHLSDMDIDDTNERPALPVPDLVGTVVAEPVGDRDDRDDRDA